MSKLIELVNGSFEQSHYDKTNIDNYPYIAFSNTDNKLLYTHIPNFFYIESLEDENVIDLSTSTWIGQKKSQIRYSLNKRKWFTLPNSYTLNKGEKMYFRCIAGNIVKNFNNLLPLLKSSKTFDVGGDISTVIYGEENVQTIINGYAMGRLFYNTKVVDASKLLLPATTLAESCYSNMFSGCTSLTTTPELPATTLAPYCYGYMFHNCTSLTTAPELPATTLTQNCYYYIFSECTSLTTAPELPATTLAPCCYQNMFQNCTSLTTAPELPATVLAEHCYSQMFSGCTSLTTTQELPAMTLADWCYQSMFSGCTSLTAVPELPATTLAVGCYQGMFQYCTSLTIAPELPATELAPYCYQFLFNGCTNLNYIKCLATAVWATDCTNNWVNGVSFTGTFVKHPKAKEWDGGINGMPDGWKVVNAEVEDEDL